MNVPQPKSADYARMTEPTTLVIQRWLPGPVERVWKYLTDGASRARWLAAGDMTLEPGAPFELVWRNDDLSDATDPRPDGFEPEHRMKSRIIAVDPPRTLTFSWGNGDVTFELEPQGDQVQLTLTHRGLDDREPRTMIAAGWHTHLDVLVALAADAQPASFWTTWAALQETYTARLTP